MQASQAAGVVLSAIMSVNSAPATALSTQPLAPFDNRHGAFELRVVDQQGAVIVGAHVSVVARSSGKTIEETTSRQGVCRMSHLTADSYNLSVVARGFATYDARVRIVAGRLVTFKAKMALKMVLQETAVEGIAPLVETIQPSLPPSIPYIRAVGQGWGGGPSFFPGKAATRNHACHAWIKRFRISRLWRRTKPSNNFRSQAQNSSHRKPISPRILSTEG